MTVTVEPEFGLPASNRQVSCANGKLSKLTEPPLDVAQPLDQFPPPEVFQYLSAPAPKVIPVLPFPSPSRVPVRSPPDTAAPAIVMSRKSMSVREATAAQVRVRVTPMILDRTKVLIVAFVPAKSVRVPFMVWSADRASAPTPAEVRPATVRLLKVFEPAIDGVLRPLLVKLTL